MGSSGKQEVDPLRRVASTMGSSGKQEVDPLGRIASSPLDWPFPPKPLERLEGGEPIQGRVHREGPMRRELPGSYKSHSQSLLCGFSSLGALLISLMGTVCLF